MMKTIKKLILVLFAAAVVWAQNVNDLQVSIAICRSLLPTIGSKIVVKI